MQNLTEKARQCKGYEEIHHVFANLLIVRRLNWNDS